MSSELEFDTDIDALGTALGAAIADLPEYEAFEAAQAAVEASEAAQARIEEFESRREQLLIARQLGEVDTEDIREIRAVQEELHALPVMREFREAQTALDDRLAAVNDAISDELGIDFAGQAGGCCQD